MNTLCVDIGNYSVLTSVVDARERGDINMMRSLIYDCTHNGECRTGMHTVDSPLVNIGNKTYKLGRFAKNYPGFLSAVEAGKNRPDVMLPILLGNTPDGFEGKVKILVPARDEVFEKLIKSAVTGHHTYQVTKERSPKSDKQVSQSSVVHFTEVEFVRETDAAAKFAYESGAIPPDDVALVIDIGGGTINAVVCSYEDDVFNVIYRKSYDNSGGIALAQTIANTDAVKSYGRAFEIAKIMDAITEGKTHVGNRPDLSFEAVFDDCLNQWFESIITRVMSAADKYLDEVTTLVWCGGGAEIVRDRLHSGGHLILDNPQQANINGLIHSAKTPALRAVA
jgi:hypothetical protein